VGSGVWLRDISKSSGHRPQQIIDSFWPNGHAKYKKNYWSLKPEKV